MKIVICACLFIQTLTAAYGNIITKTISIDAKDFYQDTINSKHILDLNLVLLENSKWTQEDITTHIKKTAQIYQKCDVRMGAVNLHFVAYPYTNLKENFYPTALKKNTMGSLVSMLPKMKKPVLFFIDKLDEVWDSNALALPPLSIDNGSFHGIDENFVNEKLINITWLGSDILTYPYDLDSGYNPIAHELGHILLNQGHIDDSWPREQINPFEPKTEQDTNVPFPNHGHHGPNHKHYTEYNLMISARNSDYRTDFLKRSQCQKIKESTLLNRL